LPPLLLDLVDSDQSQLYSDIQAYSSDDHDDQQLSGMHAAITTPIRLDNQPIGFLMLFSKSHEFFNSNQITRLQAFANQAAIAIQNARLNAQARQAAVVEERNRISHELHDAVSQTLWSASLIADVLPAVWARDPQMGRQNLQELRHLTRGALAKM